MCSASTRAGVHTSARAATRQAESGPPEIRATPLEPSAKRPLEFATATSSVSGSGDFIGERKPVRPTPANTGRCCTDYGNLAGLWKPSASTLDLEWHKKAQYASAQANRTV